MNERNVTIDIAKGIAVLCMIAGHTFSYSKYPILCSMIFIWNMPLFFILSGYFFNSSRFCISKNIKALLKPYISTGIIIIAICFLKSIVTGDVLPKTLYELKAVVWGWGAKPILHGDYPIPNDFPTIGPIWFLLALLWCKLIYYSIAKITILLKIDQWIHLIVCIVSLGALCVSYYYSVPLSILQGLHAVLYFHIGHYLHISEIKYSLLGGVILGVLIYAINIPVGGTSLVINYYPFIWLNIPGALAGTWLICKISSIIEKSRKYYYLDRLGQISLVVFCIHAIDLKTNIGSTLSFHNVYFLIIIRGLLAYVTIPISQNKYVKKVLYI